MTADRAVRTVDRMLAAPELLPPPTPLPPPPRGPAGCVAAGRCAGWSSPPWRRSGSGSRATPCWSSPILFVLVVPFEKLFPRHRQRLRRPASAPTSPTPWRTAAGGRHPGLRRGHRDRSAWPGSPGSPCARSSTPCRRPPASSLGVVLFDLVDVLGPPVEPRGPVPLALPPHPPLDRHLDWISGLRVHPFDGALLAPPFVFLLAAGFSAEVAGALAIVQFVTGLFLHANVRWRWRPLHRSSSRPSSTTGTTPTSPTPTTPTTRCSCRCGTSSSAPTSCPATGARRATASRRRRRTASSPSSGHRCGACRGRAGSPATPCGRSADCAPRTGRGARPDLAVDDAPDPRRHDRLRTLRPWRRWREPAVRATSGAGCVRCGDRRRAPRRRPRRPGRSPAATSTSRRRPLGRRAGPARGGERRRVLVVAPAAARRSRSAVVRPDRRSPTAPLDHGLFTQQIGITLALGAFAVGSLERRSAWLPRLIAAGARRAARSPAPSDDGSGVVEAVRGRRWPSSPCRGRSGRPPGRAGCTSRRSSVASRQPSATATSGPGGRCSRSARTSPASCTTSSPTTSA